MNSGKQKLETIQLSPPPGGWNERRASHVAETKLCDGCRTSLEILAAGTGPGCDLECSTECPQCGQRGPTFTFHNDGRIVLWRSTDSTPPVDASSSRNTLAESANRRPQRKGEASQRPRPLSKQKSKTQQSARKPSLSKELARGTLQSIRRAGTRAGVPPVAAGLVAFAAAIMAALVLHAVGGFAAVLGGGVFGAVTTVLVSNCELLRARAKTLAVACQKAMELRKSERRRTRQQNTRKPRARKQEGQQSNGEPTTEDLRRKAAEDFVRFRVESSPWRGSSHGERRTSEYDSSHFIAENALGISGIVLGIAGGAYAWHLGVPVGRLFNMFAAVFLLVLIILGTPIGAKILVAVFTGGLVGGGDFGAAMGTGATANRTFSGLLSPLSCLGLSCCLASGLCIIRSEQIISAAFAEPSDEPAATAPQPRAQPEKEPGPAEKEPDDPGRQQLRISDEPLTGLKLLENGHRLLVTSLDGSFRSLDPQTFDVQTVARFDTGLMGLGVSSDGSRGVVAGQNFFGLQAIDLTTGEITASTRRLDDPLSVAVGSFCFGPESDVLLGGLQDGRVAVLNAISLRSERATDRAGSTVTCIISSSDGQKIYSGDRDGAVFERDFLTGNTLREFHSGNGRVVNLSLSSDGHWLAAVNERGLACVWSLDDATLKSAFTVSGQSLFDDPNPPKMTVITFLPNSDFLAIGTRDGAVSIHSIETGEPLFEWHDHSGSVAAVACVITASARSEWKLASAGREGQIVLRTLPESLSVTTDQTGTEPVTGSARGIAKSPQETGRVETTRVETRREERPRSDHLEFEQLLPAAEGVAERLVISPNGAELIAFGSRANLRLDLRQNRITERDAAFPDFWSGNLRFGIVDTEIVTLRNGTAVSQLQDEVDQYSLGSIRCTAFSESGRSVFVGWTGGALTRHSVRSGRLHETFQLPGRTAASVMAVLPDSSALLVAGSRGQVTLHNAGSLEPASSLLTLPHAAGHAAFHPVRPLCAIGSRYQLSSDSFSPGLTVFDTATGQVLLQDDELEAALFTPDGRFLITTSRSRQHAGLTVWNTADWTQHFVSRMTDRVSAAILTSDGNELLVSFASGGLGRIRLSKFLHTRQ